MHVLVFYTLLNWKMHGETVKNCCCYLFSWPYNPLCLYFRSPVAGFSLLVFEVSWSHTTTPHSRKDSSGRVINPSQRSLPDNTQHSQQTNIHAPGEIRTHDLSRRAAEVLRLRPRGHWDWQCVNTALCYSIFHVYLNINVTNWIKPTNTMYLRNVS